MPEPAARSNAIRAALVAHVTNDLNTLDAAKPHTSQPNPSNATQSRHEPRRRSWLPGWALTVAVVLVAGIIGTVASTAILTPSDTAASPPPHPSTTASTTRDGNAATWWLLHPEEVTADSTVLNIGVTRLGCAGGVTGEVLTPRVVYEPDRVLIEVDVAALPNEAYDCPGNDEVPATVALTEPIGERILVDGACLDDAVNGTANCLTAERWPATEREGQMIGCAELLDDIRLLLIGPVANSGYETSCDDTTREVRITVQPGMREQAAQLLRQYGPLIVVDEFPYPMGTTDYPRG